MPLNDMDNKTLFKRFIQEKKATLFVSNVVYRIIRIRKLEISN